MITLLIAVQKFTVAIILAWMGFSVSPDSDDNQESMAPVPNSSFISSIAG
ncbi:MAG: hypothetical protein AAFN91_16920 [Pseudomonadota bacterium]